MYTHIYTYIYTCDSEGRHLAGRLLAGPEVQVEETATFNH